MEYFALPYERWSNGGLDRIKRAFPTNISHLGALPIGACHANA